MADGGGERDSWVVVDSPEQPTAEETKEDPSSVQDTVEEPQEKAAEPEPEVEPEPQVEQEDTKKEQEPESEKQPEPEPEAEPAAAEAEPAAAEAEAEPESQPETVEVQVEPEPEPAVELESETKPEQEPEPEVVPEAEPEVKQESSESSPSVEPQEENEGEKPAEETEEKTEGETVEVEVELGNETTADGETAVEANGEADVPPEKPRTPTPEPGMDIMVAEYIQLLKTGTDMQKVRKNKLFPRLYFLEGDLTAVAWKSNHKRPNKARIPIANIKEVRPGRGTETFRACHAPGLPEDDLCFSIIYKNGSKTVNLDLATFSLKAKDAWVWALKVLIRGNGSGSSTVVRYRWLRDLYETADKDSSGSLSVKEVLTLMKELNVSINKKVLKQKFKAADEDGNYDGTLNFEEFCTLFRELSERQEVNTLFTSYSSKQEYMTTQDIQRFMTIEQGAHNISAEVVMGCVQKYEPTFEGKEKGWMTVDGFHQFLLGPENDLFIVDHGEVYQDMSHPFPHYYLASSHNTYLLEDQLVGPSSIEGYITALRKGCRCVELDCWDGPDGEPIIYHGHTATSKISFLSVVEAVKEHAFVFSTYPVVLSIENHCSVEQQNRMAEIMMDVLGDLLYLDARDDDTLILPPPSALRHKILIKGKKLQRTIEEADDMDEGEISEEDEAAEIDPQHRKKEDKEVQEPAAAASEGETKTEEKKAEGEEPKAEEPKAAEGEEDAQTEVEAPKTVEAPKEAEEAKTEEEKPREDSPVVVASEESADKEAKTEEQTADKETQPEAAAEPVQDGDLKAESTEKRPRKRSIRLSFRSRQRRERPDTSSTPKKKIKLSKKLSRLVNYFQSVHFATFDQQGKCYQMSSFGENFAMKKASSEGAKFVSYNKHQISRVYPAGVRVNSSNYDPVPMWNVGCHMVALNYQTSSEATDLNDGKFLQNGGCGYILKPDILRDENARYNPNENHATVAGTYPKVYTIKVISGQNLPKPGDKNGEIVDPYVVLHMVGVKEDRKEFKTKVVKDNGFNPEWKETFTFQVAFPEMALLRVSVMDKDLMNQDDFIGSCSVPVTSIAPGYRHIQLSRGGNKLPCATVFVHVQVHDVITPSKALIKAKTKLRVKKTRQIPENHQVGFAAIDDHFRHVGQIFRHSVDAVEDFKYSVLIFNESCGHGPHVDMMNSTRWMLARAEESEVAIRVEAGKDSLMLVARTGEGRIIPVPSSLHTMADTFNEFLQASKTLTEQADGMAEELEKIRSEGLGQKEALKQQLHDVGVASNYRKAEQVWDNYYKTLFSLKTMAADLRKTSAEAAELRNKVFAALPEPVEEKPVEEKPVEEKQEEEEERQEEKQEKQEEEKEDKPKEEQREEKEEASTM